MKKSIYFIASCAVALASCSQTDVIEEGIQSNAIGFENIVSKPGRADLTKTSMNKFYVYAYYTKANMTANPVNVFDGEEISLSGDTWGYANTRYWVPDATYYFYAYSCQNSAITSANGTLGMNLNGNTTDARALNISDYICNDSHQHDLVFASNTGIVGKDKAEEGASEPNNKKVGFTFKHILTKVNAEFISQFAPDYDIVISDVKIVNMYDKGDYNSSKNEWGGAERTVDDKTVTLAVSATNNIATADPDATKAKTVKTAAGYVLPHEYSESWVRLEFKIEVKQGNDVFLSRNMVGSWQPNWKVGYSYTYKINISGTAANLEPIVFESKDNMNIDDWTNGNEDAEKIDFNFSAN